MKGLIVIGASAQQLRRLMAPLKPHECERVLSRWPGPHTWLVPAARNAPHWITGGRRKIALRVPGHAAARALCTQVRSPLVSTSANRSGEVPIKSYRECLRRFGSKVLALRGKIGQRKQPSRIEDLRSGNIIR